MWENFGGEKLANLVNCGLFGNILLANYFIIELLIPVIETRGVHLLNCIKTLIQHYVTPLEPCPQQIFPFTEVMPINKINSTQ